MTLLGATIGLSVSGTMSAKAMGLGDAIWSVLVTTGGLFFGSFLATQVTAIKSPPKTSVNRTHQSVFVSVLLSDTR